LRRYDEATLGEALEASRRGGGDASAAIAIYRDMRSLNVKPNNAGFRQLTEMWVGPISNHQDPPYHVIPPYVVPARHVTHHMCTSAHHITHHEVYQCSLRHPRHSVSVLATLSTTIKTPAS
jgi:hypothetical protein